MSADCFRVERIGSCAVIAMPAEIDVTNSDRARQALLAAVGNGVGTLIVDMTETMFCDSTGVSALVDAYQHAITTGTQLRLVAPRLERILMLTGFGQIVAMHPTLGAARAAADSISKD